jgi:hypothetical protein
MSLHQKVAPKILCHMNDTTRLFGKYVIYEVQKQIMNMEISASSRLQNHHCFGRFARNTSPRQRHQVSFIMSRMCVVIDIRVRIHNIRQT